MKSRGENPESIFKWEQGILKNIGGPYIPEIISQEIQKLRRLGKKEQASTLESKLEELMQK